MMTLTELQYYVAEIKKATTDKDIESVLHTVFAVGAESTYE